MVNLILPSLVIKLLTLLFLESILKSKLLTILFLEYKYLYIFIN